MSLFTRIRDAVFGPKLRNKPGGMAWVRGVPGEFGAQTLNGQAVKTIRLNAIGSWDIEPALWFIATDDAVTVSGVVLLRGNLVRVTGIEDKFLEPWKDIGDGERSEELAWLPPVPAGEPRKVAA